jgi:hypothetical protein
MALAATSLVSPLVRTALNSGSPSSTSASSSSSRLSTSLTLSRGGDDLSGFVGLRRSRRRLQICDRKYEERLAARPGRSWRTACANVLENAAVMTSNKEPAKYEVISQISPFSFQSLAYRILCGDRHC